LCNFVIDLFLSGNGTLNFSNAFVEWAASEALRRARPQVMVARFGLRSKPKPSTGIDIFENQQRISTLPDVDDAEGSAVDALILARYVWLAASRNSVFQIASPGRSPEWIPKDSVSLEDVHNWLVHQLVSDVLARWLRGFGNPGEILTACDSCCPVPTVRFALLPYPNE
jgi:hypothetical protein